MVARHLEIMPVILSAGAEALSPSLRSRVNSAKGKDLCVRRARPFAKPGVTAGAVLKSAHRKAYLQTSVWRLRQSTNEILYVMIISRLPMMVDGGI